jgi:putative membrane protein insertion efficiency factor
LSGSRATPGVGDPAGASASGPELADSTPPPAGGGDARTESDAGARRAPVVVRALRAIASAPIVVYSRVISPGLPRRCKYEPTCSRYALDAIREYGILRGVVLAGWRLLRCNPWSYGGYDPVEAQRVFRASPHAGG